MVTSLLSDKAVSEVVTVAVKIEIITKPMSTQMKAKTLAMKDLGARSPYLAETQNFFHYLGRSNHLLGLLTLLSKEFLLFM